LRKEEGSVDGRHPEKIIFDNITIQDDLNRRDFTINAMALEILDVNGIFEDMPIDPFFKNGKNDVENAIIRFIGDANKRIEEDKLRILRAFRFLGLPRPLFSDKNLKWHFSLETEKVLREWCKRDDCFEGISIERINEELNKILVRNNPIYVLETMAEYGLLWKIIPELPIPCMIGRIVP